MTGEQVGPYRVIRKLGSGGMGDVYLADDSRLRRQVALKRPSSRWLAAPDSRLRLHREARAAAGLSHPNIAAVYDVLDVGPDPYIVMEYVEGETLAEILRRGPLPAERVLELGLQLADAMAAAHARGIVHRDLKPANISITPDGRAKVLDFGLARAREGEDGPRASTSTQTGRFAGTPGYSPPEQMAGARADPRDDLYSLGVVLFEALTGRRPFEERDPMDLALAAMSRTPPRASEINPAVPSALSAVVARALARDRHERFASAAELHAALQDVRAGLASARTGTFAVARPRPAAVVVVVALVLIVAAAAIIPMVLGRRGAGAEGAGPPVVAVLPFDTNSSSPRDRSIARGMRDVLIANLGGQPGMNVLSRASLAETSEERTGAREIGRSLGATYLIDGTLHRSGDDMVLAVTLERGDSGVIVWSRTYSAGEADIFALLERVAEGVSAAQPLAGASGGGLRPARAGTRNVEALELYGQAVDFLERLDIAGNAERAAQLLRTAVGRDPQFALAWARLGEAYWALYETHRDPAWTEKATEAIYEALRLDREQPRVWISLARIHHGTGRSEVAVDELHQALALQPNSDDAHRLLGEVLQELGRLHEAEQEYKKAIAQRPNYWRNHSVLGGLYYAIGRYDEAIDAFTRVTELQPDNARGFHNVGTVHHTRGDMERALEWYQKAVAVSPVAPMPDTHSNMGNIYYDQGRYEAAAAAFAEAIRGAPNQAPFHGNLGDALMKLGDRARARAAYEEAVRLDREALAVNPKNATAMGRLAVHQAKLGQAAAARRNAAKAVGLRENDGELWYRAAVVHAVLDEPDAAVEALARALQHGYSAALAARDGDLAGIRRHARFRQLVGAQ